ncbi:MAG: hypothetical protein IJ043_03910 [Clostridia bacterium]|nr:hypothetical protein [Clostridia bacterium]
MTNRQIIRRHKTVTWVSSILILLLYILVLILFKDRFGVQLLLLLAFMVLMRLKGNVIYNRYFTRVLAEELDPLRFLALHAEPMFFLRTSRERIMGAYYCGDYQTAVNLCHLRLQDKKLKKAYYLYWIYLARIAFETGDLEALRRACNAFEAQATEKQRNAVVVMKFYRMFLNGDYKGGMELYRKVVDDPRYNRDPLDRISCRFTYAVACRICGETETAQVLFKYVAENAGGIHLGGLARRYLEDECYAPSFTSIRPDPAYRQEGYEEAFRKAKRFKIIIWSAAAVVLAVVLGVCLL